MTIAVGTKVRIVSPDFEGTEREGVVVDVATLPAIFNRESFSSQGHNAVEVEPDGSAFETFAAEVEGNENGSIHYGFSDEELEVVA